MRRPPLAFALSLLAALSACGGPPEDGVAASALVGADVCDVADVRPGPVSLLVTPDDGDARVIALLDGATQSVDVTIYELSSPTIVPALVRAAARGVTVRVIQDWRQMHDDVTTQLEAGGAAVHPSSHDFVNTHQKTITVDRRHTFLFSGNFDAKSFGHARNYGVFDDDPDDVADVEELFEADWAGRPPDLACTRLLASPINARDRVLAFLASATGTLDVEALYITDRAVEDALVAAHDRGVAVRVVLNDPAFHMVDSTALAGRLATHGIEARRSGTRFVHAKLLVADGARAFVGSENFSPTSLDKNREAGVLISTGDSDLSRLTDTFALDWTAALPFAPTDATGDP